MIAKIEGILEELMPGAALVRTDGSLSYEVLLPAFAAARLGGSIGQPITLYTLYFIEGQAQGTTMTPRLAGFLTVEDRRFFELFTTCKGIGNRRALRAMTLESSAIAAAIADRDAALLQSLPEIGKRTAETVIATLRGKVDPYLATAAYGHTHEAAEAHATPIPGRGGALEREALEVLLQLGENRTQCINWIDQVMRGDERPTDTETLIARVYRMKTGA